MTYQEFINNILQTRGRFNCGNEYHERHHIIPKCMGGTNNKENLIDLFAREHFEAHRLLVLENPDNDSLIYAWWSMAFMKNKYTKERYEITAKEYEKLKMTYANQLSKKNKGENNPNYGKCASDEKKRKISNSRKGKCLGRDNLNAKIICQFDLNMNILNIWESIQQASNILGLDDTTISMCCTGRCKTVGGYYWKYYYDQTQKDGTIVYGAVSLGLTVNKDLNKILYNNKFITQQKNGNHRVVCQFDLNMNLVMAWECLEQASEALGIGNSTLSNCCFGKYATSMGYYWRYLYDKIKKDGTIVPGVVTLGIATEEEVINILKKQKNININNANFKSVCQFDSNMNIIKIWTSLKVASDYLCIDLSSIAKCCKGTIKSSGGYYWRYLYDQKIRGMVVPGAVTLGLITEDEISKMLAKQDLCITA